jgi:hypothetical protein
MRKSIMLGAKVERILKIANKFLLNGIFCTFATYF